jgi:hypothetical protein
MHTVCPTVEKLELYHASEYPDLTPIFQKFPGLKSLKEQNMGHVHDRDSDDDDDVIVDLNNVARIEYFKSRMLPSSVEFMRSVKHLVFECDFETLDRFVGNQ